MLTTQSFRQSHIHAHTNVPFYGIYCRALKMQFNCQEPIHLISARFLSSSHSFPIPTKHMHHQLRTLKHCFTFQSSIRGIHFCCFLLCFQLHIISFGNIDFTGKSNVLYFILMSIKIFMMRHFDIYKCAII